MKLKEPKKERGGGMSYFSTAVINMAADFGFGFQSSAGQT